MRELIIKHKWKLIVSCVLILLPAVFGVFVWDMLPDRIATHWGLSGEANGFSSKGFTVFGMPLVLLAFHLLCILFTLLDKKNRGQSNKVFSLVLFIIPVISIYVNAAVYASAFGFEINIAAVSVVIMGIVFAFIGNYLPKCKQNGTIGIRINWNATHRFAGKLWLIGGIAMIALMFFPPIIMAIGLFGISFLLVLVPCIFSWRYCKKHK